MTEADGRLLVGDLAELMIGVVGGGQLAQMLINAAHRRGISVAIQTSSRQDPAAGEAERIVIADPKDAVATHHLISDCNSITFENEWINVDALLPFEQQGFYFTPSLSALSHLVDKKSQRRLLDNLGIPCPEWIPLTNISPVSPSLPPSWKFPVMAKACRGGYDGKGTCVVHSIADLSWLINSTRADEWILEAWVHFEQELALVASRDADYHIRSLPLCETYQASQICDWVLAPAAVSQSVQAFAYNIAASLLTHLNYIGVLALEFFYGPRGLQVNEIAPRVHNSGHFSIEACSSSQFDQQICIAAGLSVPEPKLLVPGAVMVNLLGLNPKTSSPLQERLQQLHQIKGADVHWYGKSGETVGRKLGHVTVVLNETDALSQRRQAIYLRDMIRTIWPFPVLTDA